MKLNLRDKRILHISHNDTDGKMCQVLTNILLSLSDANNESIIKSADFINVYTPIEMFKLIDDSIHNKTYFNEYDVVLVTDLNINREDLDKIKFILKDKFYFIDHHQSNLVKEGEFKYEDTNCYIQYMSNVKECATSLYHKLLRDTFEFVDSYYFSFPLYQSPLIEEVVDITRLYDTYSFKGEEVDNPSSKYATRFNRLVGLFDTQGYLDYLTNYLTKSILITSIDRLLGYHKRDRLIGAILDHQEEEEKKYIEKKLKNIVKIKAPLFIKHLVMPHEEYIKHGEASFKKPVDTLVNPDLDLYYILAENHQSALGNAICEQSENPSIAFMISDKSVSIRTSSDDIDISKIASLMDGGGHLKASGFPLTPENMIEIAKTHLRQIGEAYSANLANTIYHISDIEK